MKIEFPKEFIRDLVSAYGVNHAIEELVASFRNVLSTEIEEIEQEVQEEIKVRRAK